METMSTSFEPPRSSSDQEFQYLAVGMVSGAVPGIVVGLLLALAIGHAAMWVSVCGGIGIILGGAAAAVLYRLRRRSTQAASSAEPARRS